MADAGPVTVLEDFRSLPERGLVSGRGVVRSVTYVPVAEPPRVSAVVAEDADRPGLGPALSLVWLGRRRVSGLGAGSRLRFAGMLAHYNGVPTIYNPRYEILAQED